MKKKILIADDEKRIRIMLTDFLESEGYKTIEASNGQEAVNFFYEDPNIHLIILDIMMPVIDGLKVCQMIRKVSDIPIIMLTAKNTELDELQGFQTGSDEYIKKPFNPMILIARVNAIIKRTYHEPYRIEKQCHLLLDHDSRSIILNGKKIELRQIEYKLLNYLMENEGHALSREQLLDSVWGYSYEGSDRTVDTHMNRLRNKLNQTDKYIHTVWGYGYKFEVTE